MRRFAVLLAAAVAGLALAAAAGAAPGQREQVHLVPADQALAQQSVLARTDLGNGSGWSGGARKPLPPQSFTCGSYHARQSDLVLTGAAAADWAQPGIEFDSEAQVLRTPGMLRLDWARTVTHAGVQACLRRMFASGLPKGQALVSFGRLAFPKVTPLTEAFRGVVRVSGAQATGRVMVDVVVVGAGRVELTLITTAPYAARTPVTSAEAHLAQLMAARAQPGAA